MSIESLENTLISKKNYSTVIIVYIDVLSIWYKFL